MPTACRLQAIVGHAVRAYLRRPLRQLPDGTPRLTPDQALALALYTFDLSVHALADAHGCEQVFVCLNELLRQQNDMLAYLLSALQALPAHSAIS